MPIGNSNTPNDYTLQPTAPGSNMADTVFGGIKTGMAISDDLLKSKIEAMQRKQQAAMQSELGAAAENPDPQTLLKLSIKYPSLAKDFKISHDALDEQNKKAQLDQLLPVHAALNAGNPDAAIDILKQQATAQRNSGKEQQAKATENIIKVIQVDPRQFNTSMGIMIASIQGPEKYAENFVKLQKAPAELAKAEADADKAKSEAVKSGVDAKFAESTAVADLEKKGWDITKIQNDVEVAKQNAKIAMINAQIARESNQLKREELGIKVEEARMKRDEHIKEKAYEAETALTTIDQSEEIIKGILSDKDTLKAITGGSAFRGSIPGTKGKSMVGKIEQLQNTIASANLDKLKGAMSDKDIVFLKNIATSLDRSQNEQKFEEELKRIMRTLVDSRARVAKKFGAPGSAPKEAEPPQQRTVTVDF